jgi:YVTN family beta-propeller protein
MNAFASLRSAALAAMLLAGVVAASSAQTVGTRIPVGNNPKAVAVNPVTNKVYVANADDDTVTVINVNTGATKTIVMGDYPAWLGINSETNTIYAGTQAGANVVVIDGVTDTINTTLATGGAGWMAVNPIKDTTYVIRYGGGDEVNVIEGRTYQVTSATRSFQPVAIAVNPTNNRMYVANAATGDIAALNMTSPVFYPPLLCPDGSGGFRPQPPDPPTVGPDPYNQPCIDIANVPASVAVNPVTNKVYALSTGATNQISVINGTNHTFTALTPPGVTGAGRVIAVNPVNNTLYAAFALAVVAIDGATNAMTLIPQPGGPVAIGINPLTNMVYVPSADGTMLVINSQTGATNSVTIPVGANAIAVNPITNTIYVLDANGGVTPVTGAAGTATSTGITTTITPLPGDTGGTSGTFTLNATSIMTPAPLNAVRRVYYRFDNTGQWLEATGTGPYPAAYSGLSAGPHTIQAFAVNGLEAPSINTDLANVPIVGNIASYAFMVSDQTTSNPGRLINLATRGPVLTGNNVQIGGFIIGGSSPKTVVVRARGPSLTATGVPNALANPVLQLFQGQTQLAVNDNWGSAPNAAAIQSSGFAPPDAAEAAILAQLAPGAYTAIVTGAGGTTGVGLVEIFEVDAPSVPLINIATRGPVLTGSDVMIGGFIIQGSGPQTVVVRARGPSLAQTGVPGVLANPVLQLFQGQTQMAVNDDWGSASNAAAIQASGFAPPDALESAILVTLQPGAYTAIVTGAGGTTGVGIVEVFDASN